MAAEVNLFLSKWTSCFDLDKTNILSISCFSKSWPSRMNPCMIRPLKITRSHSFKATRVSHHSWSSGFRSWQRHYQMLIRHRCNCSWKVRLYFAKSSLEASATCSGSTNSFEVDILRWKDGSTILIHHWWEQKGLTPILTKLWQLWSSFCHPQSSVEHGRRASYHVALLQEWEQRIRPCSR
jgi:hypothetical protein